MTSIDCTDIKAILSPYIDGELDDETRHLAERHLGECQHCRSLVDQAEQLDALVAADVRSSLPAGVSPDFLGSVMARTVYADPPEARFTGRRIATWLGWVAAAASITLAAGIWIDQNMASAPMVALTPNDAADDDAILQPVKVETPTRAQRGTRDRTLRDDFYTAGIDLESRTFEGALPADAFRVVTAAPTSAPATSDHVTEAMSPMPITDESTMAALLTPQPVVVSPRKQSAEPARAVQASFNAPTIKREDADALYTASILLHMLTAADTGSFADVEQVRRVVVADDLLPRLTDARNRLQPADRPAVFAAESVLTRVTQGPLDSSDVRSLRDTVQTLNLASELSEITSRWDRASSL